MPDGESLVRQLLVGKRWYQQAYGVDVRIGWNPDSFGYTWQLPQIYKKSGVDYFVTQKMTWNDTNQLPFKLFWWESPDGSKVLAYFPHDYANDNLNPVRLSDDLATARDAGHRHDRDDGPLRHRRSWRRSHTRNSGRGLSLGRSLDSSKSDAENGVRHRADLLLFAWKNRSRRRVQSGTTNRLRRDSQRLLPSKAKFRFLRGRANFTSSITAA